MYKATRNWLITLAAMLPLAAPAGDDSSSGARQAEFLDRGVVAVNTDAGVFVSWRLLGNESYRDTFNVFRDGRKLNRRPLRDTTNFLDAGGQTGSIYTVRRADDGRGRGCSNRNDHRRKHNDCAGDTAEVWASSYLSIPLVKPADGVTPAGEAYTYRANDASVGDLDGDGEYEIVLKWDPTNSKDNSQGGYTGEVYVDALKLDGTLLWRIALGRNIRAACPRISTRDT